LELSRESACRSRASGGREKPERKTSKDNGRESNDVQNNKGRKRRSVYPPKQAVRETSAGKRPGPEQRRFPRRSGRSIQKKKKKKNGTARIKGVSQTKRTEPEGLRTEKKLDESGRKRKNRVVGDEDQGPKVFANNPSPRAVTVLKKKMGSLWLVIEGRKGRRGSVGGPPRGFGAKKKMSLVGHQRAGNR